MKQFIAGVKKALGGASRKFAEDNERGARKNLMEELFYDFNRSKAEIYWVNFQRGIFFGIGSVLGGTLIIVVGAMLLNLFVDLPGGIGEFIERIINEMERR